MIPELDHVNYSFYSFISFTFLQIGGNGLRIDNDTSDYIFMVPYLSGINPTENLMREYIKCSPLSISYDEVFSGVFNWATFIEDAKDFFAENFFSFLMLLAGAVSAFHYERVLDVVGE